MAVCLSGHEAEVLAARQKGQETTLLHSLINQRAAERSVSGMTLAAYRETLSENAGES